jgi:uncharacterized protein (DUF433 family)
MPAVANIGLRAHADICGSNIMRGTRMTVTDVLEYLAGGMTQEELLKEFPDLTSEDVRACLAFAADRERKLAALPE